MKNNKYFSVHRLSIIGLMAAMVFVATYFLHWDIPTPLGKTMLHMGNVMCLLAGILFGGLTGGLSAGIGSAIYDLMDPAFAPEFWITFLLKFAMAFVAGTIAKNICGKEPTKTRIIVAAVAGAVTYTGLYVLKTMIVQYYVMGAQWGTVLTVVATKGVTSVINGVVAAIVSVLLALALRPRLKASGIFEKLSWGNKK